MPDTGPCRSCRRQVFWARSAARNKPMSLDEDDERGNVLLDEFGKAHVFRDHAGAVEALEAEVERWSASTYLSHHATCPAGTAWRGKQRTDADAPQEPVQETLL